MKRFKANKRKGNPPSSKRKMKAWIKQRFHVKHISLDGTNPVKSLTEMILTRNARRKEKRDKEKRES